MFSSNPLGWTDPSTWPLIVYVWIALLVGGWAKHFYDSRQRKKSASWPTVAGRIEAAEIPPQRTFLGLTLAPRGRSRSSAELRYSYSVEGQSYRGKFKRDYQGMAAAQEFIRDLQGLPVTVHYDPEKASVSVLLDSSIEALLQSRPPGPPAKDPIPGWLKPLLRPIAALSAIGFVISLWVHIEALLGRPVAPFGYFWMLHVGIFVVWFPALLVTQKRTGNVQRKDFLESALKGSPKWMLYLVYVVGAYAAVSCLLFMMHAPQSKPPGKVSPGEDWAGFSAVWIEFYLTAFVLLYSAARADSSSARCVNGHPLPPKVTMCSVCGQPVSPFR